MSEYEQGYHAALRHLEELACTQGAWDFAFMYGILAYLRKRAGWRVHAQSEPAPYR